MRKIIGLLSLIGVVTASGSAMAGQGQVTFFGNVTAGTCDVVPVVDGSVNNLIQLGTVTAGATDGSQLGVIKQFALKAVNGSGGNCAAATAGKTFMITWDGNLNSVGLANQGGLASDAVVLLKSVNQKNTATPVTITSGSNSVEFDPTIASTDGFKFSAQLSGGKTPGDYKSAISFVTTYL